jgi:hypothetical protein
MNISIKKSGAADFRTEGVIQPLFAEFQLQTDSLSQLFAVRILRSVVVQNIELSAWTGSVLIDGASVAVSPGMRQRNAGLATYFGTPHAGQVRSDLSDQFLGHAVCAMGCQLTVIKAHPKVLTALTTMKAECFQIEIHERTEV